MGLVAMVGFVSTTPSAFVVPIPTLAVPFDRAALDCCVVPNAAVAVGTPTAIEGNCSDGGGLEGGFSPDVALLVALTAAAAAMPPSPPPPAPSVALALG